MNNKLPYELLRRLSRSLAVKTAFCFPEERWAELECKAVAIAKEFGFTRMEEFTSFLESSPLEVEQVEILASHLTIGETYFWREYQVFEALEQRILPEIIRSKAKNEKRLRIWSAGCSSGEEAYSIAIVLRRLISDIKDWDITILATDINAEALKKAAKGVYGKWSFRDTPPWLKETYFIPLNEAKLEIIPAVKKMVMFKYLNLAEDNFPSAGNNTNAMDLIFCRNVLMYFTKELTKQIAKNFHNALSENGWLIVSSSELSQQVFSQFTSVNFPEAIVYQKRLSTAEKNVFTPKLPVFQKPGILPCRLKAALPMKEIKLVIPETKNQMEPGLHSVISAPGTIAFEEISHPIRQLANQGKLAEAIEKCEKILAVNKLNPELHFLFATILHENNQHAKAVAALNTALYLNPNFVMAYYFQGNIFQKLGEIHRAKKSFENVLALLSNYGHDNVLPEADGLTAGRLREIMKSTINK